LRTWLFGYRIRLTAKGQKDTPPLATAHPPPGRARAEGEEVKPKDAKQLRELAEQLRLLIESADRLPPSPERDAALVEIVQYRDRLNAITARKAEH
jgi:hypothetical protein